MSKFLLDLAKPFLRHSPRFTGFVYKRLGGESEDRSWRRYGKRTTRGTEHGYQMVLDLGHWSQRAAYYRGAYYDRAAEGLLKQLLRPGDTFVDVGANIGMLTLSGARAVGPSGTVLAFEPHPEARAHLQTHLEINGISYVHVHGEALSCTRGRGVLQMPTESSGRSTLRPASGETLKTIGVDLALLDDFLDEVPLSSRTLVKIDTEGAELNVLKGARRLLSRENVYILVEVTDAWLRELGQSATELFSFMKELDYKAYHPRMQPRFLRQNLIVEPVSLPGPHHQFDALFLRASIQENSNAPS